MTTNLSREQLVGLLALRSFVDELLEEGLRDRKSLKDVLPSLLAATNERLGFEQSFLVSYGEDLALSTFVSPPNSKIPQEAEVLERTGPDRRETIVLSLGGRTLLAQPLDVAGEWFGSAGGIFDGPRKDVDIEFAKLQLDAVCEVLDNYLFTIKAAREKQRVMMDLGIALRHRVLREGLARAINVLGGATPLDRLLLVYVADEASTSELQIQVYRGGEIATESLSDAQRSELEEEGREYLAGKGTRLVERYGFDNAQEEVLINGVTNSVVVGKLVASSARGPFNTYDRDLLAGFAGFIRQRIVDFNKEWRRLSASFCPGVIATLLKTDDYEHKYLSPREATVAIVYMDIAGFTRLSETVLKTPSAVASFVEAWSREAVDLLFEHGGVFDKMVGDCIIGLFGPPFYDESPGASLKKAIDCAVAIRAMTRALASQPGLECLGDEPIGISTGIHLAPLFVGTFGPNRNFTGFSSGMNNTARLQGLATRDQILVLSEAVEQLPAGHPFGFGVEGSAQVKNVAHPLRFRPLIDPR